MSADRNHAAVPLAEICKISYGRALKEGDRLGGSVPVYGSSGIVGWHSEFLSSGPLIVVGRKGSVGELHYSDGAAWPIDTTFYACPIDPRAISVKYVFRALQVARLASKTITTSIPGLSREDLESTKIPLPPIEEQRRIVAILDKADAIRRKRREAIALTEELLCSTFLEMFGDPVTNPKKWPVALLGELGTLDRGRSKHRPRNDPALLGGEHPLIQTGDVANADGVIRAYRQTYSDLGLAQSRKWPAGTLCITIAANIAQTGILGFDACFPGALRRRAGA